MYFVIYYLLQGNIGEFDFDKQTDGHGNFMTESAQLVRFSENVTGIQITCYSLFVFLNYEISNLSKIRETCANKISYEKILDKNGSAQLFQKLLAMPNY